MRRSLFALLILLLLRGVVTYAQQEVYGPEHDGMNDALWSDDGTQIMTWGASPYVYVWRDSDGLLLLELDHSSLMGMAPDQQFAGPHFISNVHWSEDGETIVTHAYPQNDDWYVLEQAWSAQTGELLYSYVIKWNHPHAPSINLHQMMDGTDYVASWMDSTMILVNINPKSESVGDALVVIDFPDMSIGQVRWNAEQSEALLHVHSERYCESCISWFNLIDADMESNTFGEILWQVETTHAAVDYIWHNPADLLAIHSDNIVELWDLDRKSNRFGMPLLQINLEYDWFHTLLFDEQNLWLIVVEQHNLHYIEGGHPEPMPACIEKNCEYHVGIWDIDPESPEFGTRIQYIVHRYPDDDYLNSVSFNQSNTQLHIKTTNLISRDPSFVFEKELTAYDLASGKIVDPIGIVIEPKRTFPPTQRPQVDLSHIGDDYYPIAVNPAGTKVLAVRWTYALTELYFVFDLETGEWLLPSQMAFCQSAWLFTKPGNYYDHCPKGG